MYGAMRTFPITWLYAWLPNQIHTTCRTVAGPVRLPQIGGGGGGAVVEWVVVGATCALTCCVEPLRLARNPIRTAATAATGSTHLHMHPVYVRVLTGEYAIAGVRIDRFVTRLRILLGAFVKGVDIRRWRG
jgi:hypothetical protein